MLFSPQKYPHPCQLFFMYNEQCLRAESPLPSKLFSVSRKANLVPLFEESTLHLYFFAALQAVHFSFGHGQANASRHSLDAISRNRGKVTCCIFHPYFLKRNQKSSDLILLFSQQKNSRRCWF